MTEAIPKRIFKVAPETIQKLLAECKFEIIQPEDKTATHVHVYMQNDYFLAAGLSACVDPAGYNAESKLWELEGYALKKDIAAGRYIPTPAELDLPPFVLRMLVEHNELAARLANLQNFINNNPKFKELSKDEQGLLRVQAQLQSQLLEVLMQRYKLLQGL